RRPDRHVVHHARPGGEGVRPDGADHIDVQGRDGRLVLLKLVQVGCDATGVVRGDHPCRVVHHVIEIHHVTFAAFRTLPAFPAAFPPGTTTEAICRAVPITCLWNAMRKPRAPSRPPPMTSATRIQFWGSDTQDPILLPKSTTALARPAMADPASSSPPRPGMSPGPGRLSNGLRSRLGPESLCTIIWSVSPLS